MRHIKTKIEDLKELYKITPAMFDPIAIAFHALMTTEDQSIWDKQLKEIFKKIEMKIKPDNELHEECRDFMRICLIDQLKYINRIKNRELTDPNANILRTDIYFDMVRKEHERGNIPKDVVKFYGKFYKTAVIRLDRNPIETPIRETILDTPLRVFLDIANTKKRVPMPRWRRIVNDRLSLSVYRAKKKEGRNPILINETTIGDVLEYITHENIHTIRNLGIKSIRPFILKLNRYNIDLAYYNHIENFRYLK